MHMYIVPADASLSSIPHGTSLNHFSVYVANDGHGSYHSLLGVCLGGKQLTPPAGCCRRVSKLVRLTCRADDDASFQTIVLGRMNIRSLGLLDGSTQNVNLAFYGAAHEHGH